MSDVLELPALKAEMSARDLVAHTRAIASIIGPQGEATFIFGSRDRPGTEACLTCRDERPDSKASEYFYDADWGVVLQRAYAWARSRPVIQRETIIRKMALAIIDITDQHGDCSERLLIARDFTREQVAELHEAACARAGEMSAGAPFSVVMGAA